MSSPGRFSALLLEGLDHYRKGRMMEAVRAWEEAYLLEPTNLRAREFLRSALERIHAHMGPATAPAGGAAAAPPVNTLPMRPAASPGPAAAPPAPAPAPIPPVGWAAVMAVAAPAAPPPSAAPTPAPPARPAAPVKPAPPAHHPWLPQRTAPTPTPTPTPPPPVAPDPQAAWLSRPSFLEAPTASTRPPLARPTSPWDDGPSMAIPQVEESSTYAGDETSGPWSIHKEALPIDVAPDDETNVWMRGARELLALNDFSGALELLIKLLERKPGDKDAQQMHDSCEHNLTLMYESKIGAMESRPRTAIAPDEVIWLNLDPRAGFVLAQIDG